MKKIFVKTINLYWVIAFALFAATGCQKNIDKPVTNSTDANSQSNTANERRMKGNFQQVNVVSDTAAFNPTTLDGYLINPWGLAFDPSGTAWIVDNGLGAELGYNATTGGRGPAYLLGEFSSLSYFSVNGIPEFHTLPTGLAITVGTDPPIGPADFLEYDGHPATTIFVGQEGFIMGPLDETHPAVDNFLTAIYTGVAIAADNGAPFIYAANFKAKRIDVYDGNWQPVNNKPFKDPSIPSDYAPYNVQNINNNLFVLYAKKIPTTPPNVDRVEIQTGAGLGYVDIFSPNGTLLTSFAKGGALNAPWGCAMAPSSWTGKQLNGNASHGKFVILIGNHCDGHINAFNQDGKLLGSLRSGTEPITIDGLYALSFAPATATTIDPNLLFFTAGPYNGTHGLFGYIAAQ